MLSLAINIDNNEIRINQDNKPDGETTQEVKGNQFQFSNEADVNMILVYRSLYLLKRKFEIYEKEIHKIYLKFKEMEKMNLIIEKGQFTNVVQNIFKDCNFSFAEIAKPNELFRVELMSKINEDKMKIILDLFNKFMNENRDKYNEIMKNKKLRTRGKLNKFEDENKVNNKENSLMDIIEMKNEDGNAGIKEGELDDDKKFDILAKSILEEQNEEKLDDIQKEDEGNIENRDIVNKSIGDDIKANSAELEKKEDQEEVNPADDFEEDNDDDDPETQKGKHLDQLKANLEKELLSGNEPVNRSESINIAWSDQEIKAQNNKRDYLLIECLPLIIADFVHENISSIVLVDFNEDLRDELRTLFDNEILQRLGEEIKEDIDLEREAKIKDLLFERLNIDNNIKVYEDLLVEKAAKREGTVYIEKMLHKLKEQREFINKKIKNLQDDNDTQNNHRALQAENENKANNTTITQAKKKGKS
jgi:hypothetical protein